MTVITAEDRVEKTLPVECAEAGDRRQRLFCMINVCLFVGWLSFVVLVLM